jgi:amino-acid N-acetyltransferase
MKIFSRPPEAGVKNLLAASGLDSSDLTPDHLEHFFGVGQKEELEGVVGLELFDSVGLLRSLAVASSRRRAGLGAKLVAHAEDYARKKGLASLYLLTVSAEPFFKRRGYHRTDREKAPPAIRKTKEFDEICPSNSALMVKVL